MSIRGRGKLSLGHARLTSVKSMQSCHLLLWATKPLLEVMPITVWSPPAQSAEPPPSRAEELGRKRPEADGDGDSLLFNAKLGLAGSRPFSEILISRGRVPCLLRKPWLYPSRGSPL